MAEAQVVAKTADIPVGESACVDFNGERVAIFNVDGAFFAIGDQCPHAGGPLSEGWIEDGQVVCPWHGWCFHLDPAKTESPDDMVSKYKVSIVGDDIALEPLG